MLVVERAEKHFYWVYHLVVVVVAAACSFPGE